MEQPNQKRYSSPLRQTQVELTQRTIMQAMAEALVAYGDAGGDSVTTIARIANISERTLYRHYPTKSDLWDAFLSWVGEKVGITDYPSNDKELLQNIEEMFRRFGENEDLMRACMANKAWSEVWLKNRSGWRESVERAITGTVKDPDPRIMDRAGAVIQLLYSGISWKSLRDHWGMDTEEAAAAAAWAAEVMLRELRQSARTSPSLP